MMWNTRNKCVSSFKFSSLVYNHPSNKPKENINKWKMLWLKSSTSISYWIYKGFLDINIYVYLPCCLKDIYGEYSRSTKHTEWPESWNRGSSANGKCYEVGQGCYGNRHSRMPHHFWDFFFNMCKSIFRLYCTFDSYLRTRRALN